MEEQSQVLNRKLLNKNPLSVILLRRPPYACKFTGCCCHGRHHVYPSIHGSCRTECQIVYTWTLLASLCFHAYQNLSYMILEKVSHVTHSVGNCVKGVVAIVSSSIFFQTLVSFINSMGTGIALSGVFFYSWMKRIKVKSKTA